VKVLLPQDPAQAGADRVASYLINAVDEFLLNLLGDNFVERLTVTLELSSFHWIWPSFL